MISQREEMISQLEWANAQIWSTGKRDWWFRNSDETVKQVAEGVNGYLFEELIRASKHRDTSAAELFRQGGCVEFT